MIIKRRHIKMARAAVKVVHRHVNVVTNGRWGNSFSRSGWDCLARWHRAASNKGRTQ